jgi:hypothetical protein
MFRVGIFFSFLLVTRIAFSAFIECDNTDNLIAEKLRGHWFFDAGLLNTEQNELPPFTGVTFAVDSSSIHHFNKVGHSGDICVYLAGTMDLFGTEKQLLRRPFVLIAINGMPFIAWLEKYGEEAFDHKYFQVSLSAGADASSDRLFLGGGHGEPMVAFKRPME